MEPATGLEPATGSLQNCYATIASCRHTKTCVESLYVNNPDSQSLVSQKGSTSKNAETARAHYVGSYDQTAIRPPFVYVPLLEPSGYEYHCHLKRMHKRLCFPHRNRTVNRSCQTAFGIWLYLFAKTPTLGKRDTYLGAL